MKARPKKQPAPASKVTAVRLTISGGGVVVHCNFSPKDAAWLIGLFTKRAMNQQ